METVNGRGIAEGRLFFCRFLFEGVPTPSGSIDVIFEVWELPTPQGPTTSRRPALASLEASPARSQRARRGVRCGRVDDQLADSRAPWYRSIH